MVKVKEEIKESSRLVFIEVGDILCGDRWKKPLTKLIGSGLRTIKGWAAGEYCVPLVILKKLRELLQKKMNRMKRAMNKLNREIYKREGLE